MKTPKIIKLIIIIMLLLIIDLGSKYFFYDLQIGQQVGLIHPSFNLGIARSIPMPVIMTMVLSIVALVAFIICFYRGYLSVIITSLLVAGTLGNLIDRTLLGGVRDFLDIGIFNFPIFNGADLFLNIGVIIFIIHEIWPGKKSTKK